MIIIIEQVSRAELRPINCLIASHLGLVARRRGNEVKKKVFKMSNNFNKRTGGGGPVLWPLTYLLFSPLRCKDNATSSLAVCTSKHFFPGHVTQRERKKTNPVVRKWV